MLIHFGQAADVERHFKQLVQRIERLGKHSSDYESIVRELTDIHEEMRLKKKVKHIRRELGIIRKVVTEEKIAVRQMKSLLESGDFLEISPKGGIERVDRLLRELKHHQEHIIELDMRANGVSKDVRETLNK